MCGAPPAAPDSKSPPPPWTLPASRLASKRLLVLGESHHADGYPIGTVVPDMTLDVFDAYRTGPWVPWMRTFDNVAAAVTGQRKAELGAAGVRAFWDDVAFYNYVPVVAASAARQRPIPAHFAAGADPFRRLLQEHQPEVVIVCGYALWGRMIPSHAVGYTANPWRPTTHFARIGDARIPALRMVHPSTAFSPPRWTPLINQLLEMPTMVEAPARAE